MDEQQPKDFLPPFFNVQDPQHFGEGFQGSNPPSSFPSQHQKQHPDISMKAFSLEQMYENCPPDAKKSLASSSFKNKFFTGIRGLFGIKKRFDQSASFLHKIDEDIFQIQNEYECLPDLFPEQLAQMKNPQNQVSEQLDDLTKKLSQIQQKAFNSISINKTIGSAFLLHFQNFLYIKEQNTFLETFQKSLHNFYLEAKKITTPGNGLIVLIYDFWMKMFKDFVREIWKHSENYTLNIFKKQKMGESSVSSCARSTTSSSQNGGDKEKRRAWSKSEIQFLQKIIDSNAVFSTARLQELAHELDRSASSISSKIAKLTKNRKQFQEMEQTSLESKIKSILEVNPQGMTKDQIVCAMGQNFEMGLDESWKSSVGSILSASKSIDKVKCPFRLKNPLSYFNTTLSNNFKDKVIQIMLQLPNYEGDATVITIKYAEIFQEAPSPQLKVNISKTLTRYDIFERESSKVLYRLYGRENREDQWQQFLN